MSGAGSTLRIILLCTFGVSSSLTLYEVLRAEDMVSLNGILLDNDIRVFYNKVVVRANIQLEQLSFIIHFSLVLGWLTCGQNRRATHPRFEPILIGEVCTDDVSYLLASCGGGASL